MALSLNSRYCYGMIWQIHPINVIWIWVPIHSRLETWIVSLVNFCSQRRPGDTDAGLYKHGQRVRYNDIWSHQRLNFRFYNVLFFMAIFSMTKTSFMAKDVIPSIEAIHRTKLWNNYIILSKIMCPLRDIFQVWIHWGRKVHQWIFPLGIPNSTSFYLKIAQSKLQIIYSKSSINLPAWKYTLIAFNTLSKLTGLEGVQF